MRNIILLFSFFSFFTNGLSQHRQIDSLLVEIQNSPNDTNKVHTLNRICYLYQKVDPKKSMYYYNRSIELSRKLNFHKGMIDCFIQSGMNYKVLGKYDSAFFQYQKALNLAKKKKYNYYIAKCLGNLGTLKRETNNYLEAIDYLRQAQDIFETQADSFGILVCYQNIGNVYYYKGDFETALDNYTKALKYSKNNLNAIAILKQNIAVINKNNKNYNKALNFYNQLIELHRKTGNDVELGITYNNIGNCFYEMDSLDKARNYYLLSLEIKDRHNEVRGKALALNNLGYIAFVRKNYSEAHSYCYEAYLLAKKSADLRAQSVYLTSLSDIDRETGNTKEALNNCKEALEIATKIGAKKEIKDCYESLSKTYFSKRDYKNAYTHLLKYIDYKDTIINENSAKTINELTIKYETDKKEKDLEIENQKNELLMSENKLMKIKFYLYLITSFLLLSVLTLIISLQKGRIKKNQQTIESNKRLAKANQKAHLLEKQNLKSELDYKNKEINNYAIKIIERIDFLEELKNQISSKSKDEIIASINHNLFLEKDKSEFKANVEHVYEAFFLRLNKKFPNLSKNEQRLSALLRIKLSSKEISTLTNISPTSVDMGRYRLRKKLGLSKDENIVDFLNTI